MNVYEILAYNDAENPQAPADRRTTTRKADALRISKQMAPRFPLVECNIIEYDEYHGEGNPENVDNGVIGLLCAYTHGKRTA